ncbi:hypothetical protein PG984_010206 [Apiospora sp. TS-2023a]
MVFSIFRHLPPELRMCVWREALDGEAEGRIFFIHRWSFRIVPTKNNISPLFFVSVEARHAAKLFYNICMPVLELPGWSPRDLMDPDEWLEEVSAVRWGRGLGPRGQSWTENERYWYHYALSQFGEAAEEVLRSVTDDQCSSKRGGCLYFNTATDRFLLSHEAYTRDKAELVDDYGVSEIPDVVVEDPHMDHPQHRVYRRRGRLLWRPRNPREAVWLDLGRALGSRSGRGESRPRLAYLGDLETRSGQPAGENEVDDHWMSYFFPAILQPPRTVLYLEIPASRSCTLVGEVEECTAKCLDIIELKIDKPKDDKASNAESGRLATSEPPFLTGERN